MRSSIYLFWKYSWNLPQAICGRTYVWHSSIFKKIIGTDSLKNKSGWVLLYIFPCCQLQNNVLVRFLNNFTLFFSWNHFYFCYFYLIEYLIIVYCTMWSYECSFLVSFSKNEKNSSSTASFFIIKLIFSKHFPVNL